jgi:hypothetical protein
MAGIRRTPAVSKQQNLAPLPVTGNDHVNNLSPLGKGVFHKSLLDGEAFLEDMSHFQNTAFV